MDFGLRDIAYIITVIIEIALPIILATIIWKKFKVSWAIFLLGIVLFLTSLIRVPLNNYAAIIIDKSFHKEISIILIFLFSALTAGIFEEGARVLAIGVIIKPMNYYKGIMYGIGHGGGGEAMVFVGLQTLTNYIILKFFPNTLSANVISQLKMMTWYLPMMGAVERIFGITIQIALSVLVAYAFISKKYSFIFIAIIYHAIVDFVAVYLNYKFGMYISEASVLLFAIIGIVIIFLLKTKKQTEEAI